MAVKLRLILLLVFLISAVFPEAAAATAPRVTADAAVLIDVETGQIYFAKNHTRRAAPASLTKIMTAVVAVENGSLDDVVTVDSRSASVSMGSIINLRKGEKITLGELLTAALVTSANDSTVAIACHVGGSHARFITMMNAKAAALGLSSTRFANTNGYHDPNHYTTAYDLARLSRYALGHPKINDLVQTREATIHWIEPPEREEKIKNSNRLLFRDYEGIDGVKTGTTPLAGNCLVASATREGRRLIAVSLHSNDRYRDCINMFDYGFKVVKPVTVAEKGDIITSVPVTGGIKDRVDIIAENALEIRIDPDDLPSLERKVEVKDPAAAPIKKGQYLGECVYMEKGQELGRVRLLAGEELPRTGWYRQLWDKVFN
ncbi:D-alanyl-D-alanine carboxypeptidase family protein [Pelotomaculum propionicicum]|uniref:D-alanyl-D-alanine carboxypeptidase family protein n=1 Tax=Pelotomaculum propionicicum TaxID=258475 RepID=UPI003B80927E